jgi:hypothetical protein
MDGQGYPVRRLPDGRVVETAPMHCPNGHAMRYPGECRSVIWQDGPVRLGEQS